MSRISSSFVEFWIKEKGGIVMEVKYNLKDGRSFSHSLKNDDKMVGELFKSFVQGKNHNSDIRTLDEVISFEKLKSIELIF